MQRLLNLLHTEGCALVRGIHRKQTMGISSEDFVCFTQIGNIVYFVKIIILILSLFILMHFYLCQFNYKLILCFFS
jgi:hypothetical protein